MSRVSIWLAVFAVACLLAVPAGAQDGVSIYTATFVCADNKSIVAKFYPDEVALTLSDGRGLDLPQVISGSGTRYANADESIQFFSKSDTAFLTEDAGDNLNYKDCVAD